MDYRYSRVLHRTSYRDDGLAHRIPLRIHQDTVQETAGALRAQKDWNAFVGPVPNYHGGLGSRFSFVRVTIPECLPDRLELMSYANEYAFLYDGRPPALVLAQLLGTWGENADHGQTRWSTWT